VRLLRDKANSSRRSETFLRNIANDAVNRSSPYFILQVFSGGVGAGTGLAQERLGLGNAETGCLNLLTIRIKRGQSNTEIALNFIQLLLASTSSATNSCA